MLVAQCQHAPHSARSGVGLEHSWRHQRDENIHKVQSYLCVPWRHM